MPSKPSKKSHKGGGKSRSRSGHKKSHKSSRRDNKSMNEKTGESKKELDSSAGMSSSKSTSPTVLEQNQKTMQELQCDSKLYSRVDELRHQLTSLYAKNRAELENATKKLEETEEEQITKLRKENADAVEKATQELQRKHKANVDSIQKDISDQQAKDVTVMKKMEEANAGMSTDQKKKDLSSMIENKEKETNSDIEKFKKARQADYEEQVARLKKQLDQDINEYITKRKVILNEMIEQVKLRMKLEVATLEQKESLQATLKMEEIIKKYQTLKMEQITKLNRDFNQQCVHIKEEYEDKFNDQVREYKSSNKDKLEAMRKEIEDKSKKERVDCETELTSLMKNLKTNLKEERREIERRIEMKKELLAMLKMDDAIKITEEEFIEIKYSCKISRNVIVFQNNKSTIYGAKVNCKKKNSKSSQQITNAVCKVNMKSMWSARHQADFAKYATKILRYLSSIPRTFKNLPNKKQSECPLPFMTVYEVFTSDQKVYIFMETMDNFRSLDSFFFFF